MIEEIRTTFEYEPDTGRLRRILFTHGLQKEYAGTINDKGYLQRKWKRKVEKEHRLVWFYHYGYFPEWIDHIDGDRLNNRIENLRECSPTENAQNRKTRNDNYTGFKGVTKHRGLFVARIQVDGKRINLGAFKTPEEASARYEEEAKLQFKKFYREGNDNV